ncbi:unnamed protein product [Effrenium voratum]|nr:unnamed protein product [Effrenium voratum]
MKEAALPMPAMEPLTARSNPPSRRESRPERAGDAPTLLSRCHALAASRTLCEEAAQRARKLQASLMEAQWREAAVMRELSIKQQELDRPCHKPLCRSTSAGLFRGVG